MDLEPVLDAPALIMKGKHRWVCVADLHIGIEVQLRRAGFNIPSQTPRMLSALEEMRTHGERLLILGDVKHRIPSVGYHEDRVVRPFLEKLSQVYEEVIIVSGNHDGGLSSILPKEVQAVPGRGLRIDDLGAFHGHVWPSEEAMTAKRLVMGHVHPSVLLTDTLGSRSNEKCWLRGKLNKKLVLERYETCPGELVVVPAFNPLLTGTPVNSPSAAMLGPMFRNDLVRRRSLSAYLLDGTNLGFPKARP
ncbi:MAG: metallophosphoesterase [Thermoplasmata archaeon]